MEIRRGHLIAAGAVIGGIALFLGADALIVTDEEELAGFVEAVTGEVTRERIDAALAWTDATQVPVEVVVWGDLRTYDDAAELRDRAHEALRPLVGERFRAIRESIRVEDGVGDVGLQVISGRGVIEADFRLRRHDGAWRVDRVRVQ